MFGSPETTTGGRALKFFSSFRLDIRKFDWIKDGEEKIGAATRIKVVKNKVASPHTEAEVRLYYGHGVSREWDLLVIGQEKGLVARSGYWFSYKGEKIGRGADQRASFC